MRTRVLAATLAVAAASAGCSTFGLGKESVTEAAPPTPLPPGLSIASDCFEAPPSGLSELPGADPVTFIREVFPCAPTTLVTVPADDGPKSHEVAAGLAARLGVPMLNEAHVTDDVLAHVTTWYRVQQSPVPTAPAAPAQSPDASPTASTPTPIVISTSDMVALAKVLQRVTHDTRVVIWDDHPEVRRLPEGLRFVARKGGILLPVYDLDKELFIADLEALGFEVVEIAFADNAANRWVRAPEHPLPGVDVWLGRTGAFERIRASLPVLSALGRQIHDFDILDGDPRAHPDLDDVLAGFGDEVHGIRLLPDDGIASWMLAPVVAGNELPGGGYLLFPGRRIVAMYGHPQFGGLGVLGEQGPEAAVQRAREIAEPYRTDDSVITVPGFDMITTLASSGPTPDGDYSAPLDVEVIRPWIEAATEAGFYVTLDFQPGRSTYLEQVRLYEEFLRLPNVGVALDPEWRLEPDQVHLQQVGSVDASEVNEVADWLAGLVREHALPQKLLVVHQFQLRMIRNRDLLAHPPELAVLIHMDGLGSIGAKDGTYAAITAGFEDRVWWGWKNFYDEDLPTPSAGHTMSRQPQPLFISYQ